MARRHDEREEDEVIDLRDRLAPYEGSALRPVEREAPRSPEAVEPEVWTPLDLGVLYQPVQPPGD